MEIEGLDVPEMGVPGYGGMVMDKESETPHVKGDVMQGAEEPRRREATAGKEKQYVT